MTTVFAELLFVSNHKSGLVIFQQKHFSSISQSLMQTVELTMYWDETENDKKKVYKSDWFEE
jgi:hypothetical protein